MCSKPKAASISQQHVAYVAGHSLGEYSALAAARALSVGDAARLLKLRGQAMQRAVPVGDGAMAALIGLDAADARAVAAEAARAGIDHDEICAVANDNAPGQVVVSGHRGAVERAIAIAREHGARRSILLAVSAPFHSPLLAPAAAAMAEALEDVTLRAPLVPLVANVSATAVSNPAAIKRLLVEQVTAMVRWRESVLYLAACGGRGNRRDRRRSRTRRARQTHRASARGAFRRRPGRGRGAARRLLSTVGRCSICRVRRRW